MDLHQPSGSWSAAACSRHECPCSRGLAGWFLPPVPLSVQNTQQLAWEVLNKVHFMYSPVLGLVCSFCVINALLGLTWFHTTSFCNLGSIAGVAAAFLRWEIRALKLILGFASLSWNKMSSFFSLVTDFFQCISAKGEHLHRLISPDLRESHKHLLSLLLKNPVQWRAFKLKLVILLNLKLMQDL